MFVGLVRGPDWGPPEPPGEPQPSPRERPRVPWRALAWVAAWCWLLALVPVADRVVGPLAGYVVLLLTVAVGVWRVERWGSRVYLRGLRDYQA